MLILKKRLFSVVYLKKTFYEFIIFKNITSDILWWRKYWWVYRSGRTESRWLKMNKLSVTIKDDNGRDCSIENIRTFQKHLMVFHKTGVSIHDENGHYFTVNDSFREMVDGLVGDLSMWFWFLMIKSIKYVSHGKPPFTHRKNNSLTVLHIFLNEFIEGTPPLTPRIITFQLLKPFLLIDSDYPLT